MLFFTSLLFFDRLSLIFPLDLLNLHNILLRLLVWQFLRLLKKTVIILNLPILELWDEVVIHSLNFFFYFLRSCSACLTGRIWPFSLLIGLHRRFAGFGWFLRLWLLLIFGRIKVFRSLGHLLTIIQIWRLKTAQLTCLAWLEVLFFQHIVLVSHWHSLFHRRGFCYFVNVHCWKHFGFSSGALSLLHLLFK